MSASSVEFHQTSGAGPEQYDATLDGETIGYVRLRHGQFEVNLHGHYGPIIVSRDFTAPIEPIEAEEVGLPEHASDGIFTDEQVRDAYLSIAARKLSDEYARDEENA